MSNSLAPGAGSAADPGPLVYSNTVYLGISHDEDNAKGFPMLDWK
jgi:hypothetical protein